VNLTTLAGSAGAVTGTGQYYIDHNTAANTVTVTYYNGTQTGNEVETLTLTHVSDTATIAVNAHGDLTVVNTGGVPGDASDGRLVGAHIYEDANNNGVYDTGVDTDTGVMTAADGSFTLPSTPTHAIFAVGGTNADTGLANTMVMTAPVGHTNLNPITTLIATYASTQNVTTVEAEAAVTAALGLYHTFVSLLDYDPLAVAATDPTNATALAVQKVAVSLAIATTAAENAIAGQGKSFLEAIAHAIENEDFTANTPLDLNAASDLQVINTMLTSAGGTALSAAVLSEISSDVSSVQAATTLASGDGSLSGVQQSVMGDIPTLTVATAAGHAAGTYNIADTAADILSAPTLANHAINISTPDAVTVAQATSLHALTNSGTTYYQVQGTYAELAPGGQVVASVAAATVILVSDTVNVAQLHVLDSSTTNTVYGLHITDTAAHVLAAGDYGLYLCEASDIIITDPVEVGDLGQLMPQGYNDHFHYSPVKGSLSDISIDLSNGVYSFASGHTVLITGEVRLATGSVADADAVAKLTSISGGATSVMFADKVWATVDQALNLPALTHGVMPTLEITNAVSLADLATIDGHVTGIINAVCITGTADELLALGNSPYFHSGMGFQVGGEYTAAQLAQLQSIAGAGVVTTTVPTPIDPTADARAPHLVSASVDPADGHKLILVFDDAINSTPSDTAYTIGKDGEATAVKTDGSGVSVSGSTVTLTLTDEIHYGQSVTLSYHGDTIADSSGNHAADITGYNVWNNMPDTTAPQFVQAVLTKAGTIILGYDEGLAANASITGYSVHVAHAGGGFDDYTCTGAVANTGDHIVTLTGAGAIATTDIVTVTYTGTGVTDTATTPNVSTGLTSAAVVNSSTLSHIADMSADAPGNGLLHLDFGIALDTSAAVLASDFDVTVAHADGSHGVAALAMSTVSSSGHSVTLQLDHDLLQGDIVTVDYHGSSIHAVDGTLAAHFTNVDVVGASEEALQMATASSFATLAASQEHLSHSDSLWVDFTDGALTNGQHDLGILNDLGAHQTLALGDSVDIDPSVHANGTDAYHVDMGHSTFTTLSLFGTGDHTVVLNNAVDTVVISDTQNGGSKLDLTNVLDTHHLTIDFSHSVSLTGTSIAADDVNATGEFNVTHDTTANTADIKYYNDTLHATAVLHLIGVDDTATIGTADTSNITIG